MNKMKYNKVDNMKKKIKIKSNQKSNQTIYIYIYNYDKDLKVGYKDVKQDIKLL